MDSTTLEGARGKRGEARNIFRRGIEMFRTFLQMVRDPNYRISKRVKILAVISILYLISPIDIIPDFIPFLGFADDVSLLVGTFSLLVKEIDAYRRREI